METYCARAEHDRGARAAAQPVLERGASAAGWWLLLPIVALAALRELWAPDEPRYAEVAREAWQGRDLLVMHLNGALYPDKPPLLYWLSGACGALFGWSEFALRLPSLFATAGSAWLCTRLARRFWGQLEARWVVLFYLGCGMLIEIGGRLQIDPLLSFLCLSALERASASAVDERAAVRDLWVAGLCSGLAALAKGPVAWLHVALALIAWRCLLPRAARLTLARPARGWIGFALLALLPVIAWATLASLRDPRLWQPLFLGQHLGRVLHAENHPGPPWEYLETLPYLLLPWTLVFALAWRDAWRAWRDARAAGSARKAIDARDPLRARELDVGLLRVASWFALVFVVFSIIPVKRELYLLPIYPAAALMCARALAQAQRRGALERWVSQGSALLLALIASMLVLVALFIDELQSNPLFSELSELHGYRPGLFALGVSLGLGALGALHFARTNVRAWAQAIAASVTCAALVFALLLVPRINAPKSARTLADYLARRPERPTAIPCVDVQPEGYRFYAGVPAEKGALLPALAREGAQFLGLATEDSFARLAPHEREAFRVLHRQRVGARELLVLGSAAADALDGTVDERGASVH